MEPTRISGSPAPLLPEPTSAELEAGASLVQEPERLESRATDAPFVAELCSAIAVGGEASVGLVLDFTEPKISVFTSGAWGTAIASGVSAGVSGQASLVRDVKKFWGSGAEHGANTPVGGASLNHTTPAPGGPRELNGITGSVGPSIGLDVHYFEGTTSERWSLSLDQLKDAMRRFAGLAGVRRSGP